MPAPRSQRLREEKFNQNVKKRGNVSLGKAAEHIDENNKPRVSNTLIAFFLVVVVGSSFVQILRMFQTSVPNLS